MCCTYSLNLVSKLMESMKFLCVGDIALGDHPKTVGHGIYSKYKDGLPENKAHLLFPFGLNADYIFGNLEYDLSQEFFSGSHLEDIQCRGISKYAGFLKEAGFNILSLANNHTYQYGKDSFESTACLLRNLDINICGTSDDFSGQNIIQKNGVKTGFIGWSLRPRQHFAKPPLYNEFSERDYIDSIVSLKKKVNVLIVSVHWGEEFVQAPSLYEKQIARKMIDAGVNVVIGHHPHVLRKIEEYKNGIIAYSLGNFISDMLWEKRTVETGALYFEITNNKVAKWSFCPAIIRNDYFPNYLDTEKSDKFFNKFDFLLSELEIDIKKHGYRAIALRELKRHKLASSKYFLTNIFRYNHKVSCQIIIDALKERFGKWLSAAS